MTHRDDALIMAGYILARGDVPPLMKEMITRIIHGQPEQPAEDYAPKPRPALTEEERALIISEKDKGTPAKDIGEMVDRSQHQIEQIASKERKKREWTPEQREAAAQRMRDRIAAGTIKPGKHARSHGIAKALDADDAEEDSPGESDAALSGVTAASET